LQATLLTGISAENCESEFKAKAESEIKAKKCGSRVDKTLMGKPVFLLFSGIVAGG
jgi:hypothetical protein